MDIETKACPFCGSNDIDLAFSRGFDGGDESKPIISAGCMNCGTCGPDVPVPKTGKIETGYEESAAAWNNRAAPVPAMPIPKQEPIGKVCKSAECGGIDFYFDKIPDGETMLYAEPQPAQAAAIPEKMTRSEAIEKSKEYPTPKHEDRDYDKLFARCCHLERLLLGL